MKHIKHNKTGAFSKLILRRKICSTLNVASIGGKNKKIQIEFRKKRTYVRCVTIPMTEKIDNIRLEKGIKYSNDNDTAVTTTNVVVTKQHQLIDNNIAQQDAINLSPSSEKIVLHNHDSVSSSVLQKGMLKNSILNVIEKRVEKIGDNDKKHILLKKSRGSTQKQFTKVVGKDVNRVNFQINYVSNVKNRDNNKGDNNKKLDNERHIRFRAREKYKSVGGNNRVFVKKNKRNNNCRLYDFNTSAMSDDFDNKERERLCIPNRIYKNKRKQHNSSTLIQNFNKPICTVVHDVSIGETISVSELASKMSIKSALVIKTMIKLGLMATINQIIDQETAQLVVEEMGHNVILRRENELEESIMHDHFNMKNSNSAIFQNRAPIVTIMGHVDHGKTSLLDYIRSTKLASTEVGGITQSIGAYHVNTSNGIITFIDTPGHAAFTAMRVRGAKLTDIVVLVVAADDGVMPQTIESIRHAKEANVPIVVAINKMDKLGANPERIQNELGKHNIIAEQWGGDVQFVNISAISGEGVNILLDAILLQAEMLELKVLHHGIASAVVIDSFIDKGRGPVVTVLVREGALKCGDIVLCGTEYGRVRAMRDEYGCSIVSVGPSMPVELLGLSGTPAVGEIAVVVLDEKKAKEVAFYRQGKCREIKLARREKVSNVEDIFSNMKNVSMVSELNVIVKASTTGFVEAICNALMNASTESVTVNVVSSSLGNITETDVILASTSNAVILGFNVRADLTTRRIVESEGINIRYYSVIYDLLEEVNQMVQNMVSPKQYDSKIIGLAEVRSVFFSPKHGYIAGCMVIEGMIKRDKKIRVIRNNIVIYDGVLESLRRFKNDVHEVRSGVECGISIKNYNDISVGDIIEVCDCVKKIF